MQQLTVRRAGAFEASHAFALPVFFAIYAQVEPGSISPVISGILNDSGRVFWLLMGLAGAGGFVATMHPNRLRSVDIIKRELRTEATALLIICGLWALYGIAAWIQAGSVIAAGWGLAYLLGGLYRGYEMAYDWRNLQRAIRNPQYTYPPPLAEGEDRG